MPQIIFGPYFNCWLPFPSPTKTIKELKCKDWFYSQAQFTWKETFVKLFYQEIQSNTKL